MKEAQAEAWLEIADFIKAQYVALYGVQAWYDLSDSVSTGIEKYKRAVKHLAEGVIA